MVIYEIAAELRAKDYFYAEKNARASVAGRFPSFSEALPVFCEAIAFGYSVDTKKLGERLAAYGKKPEEADKKFFLRLIRHENDADTVILENTRSESEYDGETTVVACEGLNEEELAELARHGIEPEEDSFGAYFEVYPVNDLLYDLSDACDGSLDPLSEELRLLVKEYAHAKGLLTNEIDPSEDGYFCPGTGTKEECFRAWGRVYGYLEEEQPIFTDSLVKYTHGYVMEFRE